MTTTKNLQYADARAQQVANAARPPVFLHPKHDAHPDALGDAELLAWVQGLIAARSSTMDPAALTKFADEVGRAAWDMERYAGGKRND